MTFALAASIVGRPVAAKNPIIDDGLADPSVKVFGGRAYIYGTHDLSPTDRTWIAKDWHVFSSSDLVTWSDSGGTWNQQSKDSVYAHEAGHLMGLPDDYTETTVSGRRVTTPKPTHEGHIMAEYGGGVAKHEVADIVKGKCPKKKK